MSEKPKVTEEERKNNQFSFVVGIFIAMSIIILLAVFFNH